MAKDGKHVIHAGGVFPKQDINLKHGVIYAHS